MSREYNNKHINVICPECKSNQILVDDFHKETYCTQCGLVLQDTTIFKVTRLIMAEEAKNRQLNNLWRSITNVNIFKVQKNKIK
jgi:hypothetical protein